MRRLGGVFLAAVLALTCILSFSGTVYAASQDRLSAQVQVSKSTLPGPGTVSLKITITNKGPAVSDVTLIYPETEQKVSLGDLGTDDTEVHENPKWEITQSMLDTPLVFEVSWTAQDGSTKTGKAPAITIGEASATVNVKAEATADKVHVEEGEKVNFKFTFENTGNVDITDAYLIAPPLNGGERLGDDFSLEPGQTNTKTWAPTVNEEITVRPEYHYTVAGDEHTLTCDPITVRIGDDTGPEVAISANADKTTVGAGSQVEFSIAVENTGSTEISNVRVTCSNGEAAQLAQDSLAPGASATATQKITVDTTQSFTYTVSGTSEGEPVTATSDAVQITVDPNMATASPSAPLDASSIIEIDVGVVTQVSKAGPIPVEVTVRNLSEETLKNIVVSAESTPVSGAAAAVSSAAAGNAAAGTEGSTSPEDLASAAASILETTAQAAGLPQPATLGTITNLAAGQSEVITGTLDIQQTANYVFKVTAEMENGTLVTSETGSALITLENSGGLGILENWQWLALIAAAIAAIVIVLVLYARKRRNRENDAKTAGQTESGSAPQRGPQKPQQTTTQDITPRQPARPTQKTAPPKTVQPKPTPAPRKAMKAKGQTAVQHYGDRNNF